MRTIDLPDTPLLTADDEVDLARRIEAGVFAEHLLITTRPTWATRDELVLVMEDGADAWQTFYTANLRLAVLVAHRAARRFHVDADDIIQECCLCLGRAIRDWDCRRGTRFSTLAWQRLAFTARCACLHMTGRGTLPERWLRAKSMAADIAWIQQAQAWRPPISLIDDIAAPEDPDDPWDAVSRQLPLLNPEERSVVEARFGLRSGKPKSYATIAKDLDTSLYHVKRLETRALEQLALCQC